QGNVATGYTGTVAFASSDPLAVLPAPYTFQPGDFGSHLFFASLTTAGDQSVAVGDGERVGRLGVAVEPVLAIAGPATVRSDQHYVLSLASTPLGGVVITSWTITWGDGTTTTVGSNPYQVTHAYTDPPNPEEISATANTS